MAKKKEKDVAGKVAADNRKARHNYFIEDTVEAGIMLTGTEVKSLRKGSINIAESYATWENGGLWLLNAYIPEYGKAGRFFQHEPRRKRKLLLKGREIAKLHGAINRQGLTLVPLSIYFNSSGRAKVELAIARGKKAHDKREVEKERDWNREKGRLMRRDV